MTDVSEKKSNIQKIEQLNIRLQNSMRAGDMAWWELEIPSGNITFNENKARMLGYKPENFKHYNDFMQFVHPEDYERTMQAFRDHLLGTKDVYECEYRIRNAEGKYLWFHDVGKMLKKEGEKIQFAGIVTNITRRKEIEKELIDSEEKFRILFKTVPVGISVTDKDGHLVENNPISEKILGVSTQEHNSRHYDSSDWKILRPDFSEMPISEFASVRAMKENKRIENVVMGIQKSVGEITWISVTAEPLNIENYGVIIAYSDITELKEAEFALREREQELKELNATKDKFFSIIAHDLKNPFNSLLGYSDLLIKNVSKYPPEKIINFAQVINKSAKGAYILLENLLEWSRLQTGRLQPELTKINARDIIAEVFMLSEATARAKNITLKTDGIADTYIEADRGMIQSVLRNLISNALKFTYLNGTVSLKTSKIDNFLQFSISDTGTGIEPEHVEKLFRIENKLSKQGTAEEKGTGLGLILCKEFIDKQSGKIWAESILGKGSTFHFTIPLFER